MKVDIIQTSFAGGEFGPSLYGRTDITQYANACKIVQNMIPRSYGSVISAPGTKYINTVSNSTVKTRLLKFVFNRSDAYVIEFGPLYFRFYTSQAIVITTGTTPFTLAHTYTESQLADVQFTQLNDVIWLTHPSHPPRKLTRSSAASWSIADAPIVGGPFLDDNITTTKLLVSATSGTVNIVASPTTASIFTLSTSTLGHHNSFWMINGLSDTNPTTGLQEVGYVQITHVINSHTATATVIKNLKPSLASATVSTTVWAEGAFSAVRGYPARVTFHERRLFYGRTNHEPQKIWGSKVFEYDNFALDTQSDDDGLNLALASNESNEIQFLGSAKSLISGTFGGAFVVNSGSTEPITPDNVNASEEVGFGASPILPKRIGSFLYYIQRFGKRLREMFYFWDQDTYKAYDRTILSPHILGDGVVDMDVSYNPETILFCVLTNGTLATMTREVDQDVTAWARHSTDGTYTSIAIIPSQTELYDEVWVIVERWINGVQKKYIEVFENLDPPTRQDLCVYSHSSLTYDAFDTATTSTVSISVGDGGHAVTTAGNVVINNSIYKLGGGSAAFDGTGDYLSLADHADWRLGGGTGDFTVESWVRFSSLSAGTFPFIFAQYQNDNDRYNMFYNVDQAKMFFRVHSGGVAILDFSISTSLSTNIWYHFAVVRSGNSWTIYQDGVSLGNTTSSISVPDLTGSFYIGQKGDNNFYLNGYIDEFRISDVARWTSNFTPPTSDYSYDSNTFLLLHLNTNFRDSAISTASITVTSSAPAFTGQQIGKRLRAIYADGSVAGEGEITATSSTTSITVSVSTNFNEASYAANRWGISASSVSGIDHLEGKNVVILADGIHVDDEIVSSGAITLDDDYFIITAGLAYDQIIQTLPKEAGTQRGTAQGKFQRFNEIMLKVNRSTQEFRYGQDASNLDYVNLAFTPTVTSLYTGILPPQGGGLAMRGGYHRGAEVYIKNSTPLPIEILSIIGTLDTNEK